MRSLMMPAQRGLKRISRVLITGGNGLIGSHLAEKLEDAGDSVTLLDLKFDSNTQSLNCEKVHGDIRDYPTVRRRSMERTRFSILEQSPGSRGGRRIRSTAG